MKDAIVVGNKDNYPTICFVGRYNEYTSAWSEDATFPTVEGTLYGVYAYNQNCVWVCGRGASSPLLYNWNGETWTDYSSQITDAHTLDSIDGNGPNNIWVNGSLSANTQLMGLWNFNGSSWTSTKQNTVNIYRTIELHLSVSIEGYCYVPGNATWSPSTGGQRIYSNKTNPNFTTFANFEAYGHERKTHQVKAVSDSQILFATAWKGTFKWNGSVWTAYPCDGYHVAVIDGDTPETITFQYYLRYSNGVSCTNISAYFGSFSYPDHWVAANSDGDMMFRAVLPYGSVYYDYQGGTTWLSKSWDRTSLKWGSFVHFTNTPTLSNQDPIPDATGIAKDTNISFDITEATVGISLTDTLLYVEGTLAYDGSTDTFQAGYDGPSSGKTVIAGGYTFTIDPTTDFSFAQEVSVRVVTKDDVVAPQSTLDETYSFTCVAALTPYLISGPVSPNPGYFINTHMEWKLGERE